MAPDSSKNLKWMWVVIILLIAVVVILVVTLTRKNAVANTAQSTSSQSSSVSQLQSCENAAHQQYDPEIADAMSNGTSRQPMMEEQQAIATCRQEYSQ